MLRALAYLMLPPHCVVCELQPCAESVSICAECEADFFSIRSRCDRCAIGVPEAPNGAPSTCGRCLASNPNFDATAALADYVSPIDGMVKAVKFRARLDLAEFFGRFLAKRNSAQLVLFGDAVVLPVPMAFERVQQRGFNQSHHIARAFAAAAGVRLVTDRLLRVRHSPPQQSLALNERRRNVRGAFAVEGALSGQRVFVVDDVMTSGSTLDEVAHVLKKAGASHVHNLIVARTP